MAVKFANLASSTLASSLSSTATAISVTSSSSFPALGSGDHFYASIGEGTGSEIVKVTGVSSNTFTVVRGQDGTTAQSFSAGVVIALRVVAAALDDLSAQAQAAADTESVSVAGDTMTGNLTLDSANPILDLVADTNADATIRLRETGTGIVGTELVYDGGSNEFLLKIGNNPAATALTINRDTKAAQFAGTLSSGAITTSGTINLTNNPATIRNNEDNEGQIGISVLNASGTARVVRWDAANNTNGAWRPTSNGGADLGITNKIWNNLFVNTIKMGAGNVEVIDSSRNISAGTISSGAITSSGNLSLSGTGNKDVYLGVAGSTEAAYISRYNNDFYVMNKDVGDLIFGTNNANKGKFTSAGNFQIGTTTVIDSSRNLTNIGTISSGSVTAGNSSTAAFLRAHYSDGSYMTLEGYGLVMNRGSSYIRPSTDGNKTLYIGGADGSLDWSAIHFRSSNGLYMTGTRFLDTDRNLTNIGTISSGAITSSGQITARSDFVAADSGGTARGYLFGTSGGLFLRYNSGTSLQIQEAGSTRVTIGSGGNATFTGTVTTPYVRVTGTGDASLSSTTHGIQVGSTNAQNLLLDNNEVLSRNNGAASTLHLQADGGTVTVGAGTTANLTVSGSTTAGPIITTGAGTTNTTNALTVRRGNNADAFTVRDDGVVLVQQNYLYVNNTAGMYSLGAFRARGGITNDGGNPLSIDSGASHINFNSKHLESVGNVEATGYKVGTTTVIDSARNISAGNITTTGRLGVGTSSTPSATLHVVGPAARPTDLASVDTASTAQFQADSSNAHSLYVAENASGALIQVNDGATNSTTAKPLALQPFGGNVGIGTGVTAPSARLHIDLV